MKRNTFAVAAIAFAVTTATIGTAVASLLPTMTLTQVWVRRVEGTAPTSTTKNVSAGTHDLSIDPAGVEVIVNVVDTTTPPASGQDTRKGRLTEVTNDFTIKTSSAVTINSGVTVQ